MRGCQRKSCVHKREREKSSFTHEQNKAEQQTVAEDILREHGGGGGGEGAAVSMRIWQAPGCFCALCCIAAVFWKEESTELHVSLFRRERGSEGREREGPESPVVP